MFKFVSLKRYSNDISNTDEFNFNNDQLSPSPTTVLLLKKPPITIIPKNSTPPKMLAKNPSSTKITDCKRCNSCANDHRYDNSQTGRFYGCCRDCGCAARTPCCCCGTTSAASCSTAISTQSLFSGRCSAGRCAIPPLLYTSKRFCTLRQHLQCLPSAPDHSAKACCFLASRPANRIADCCCRLVK